MTGPATPGQDGPSFAPPPLPEGWIAQWDGMSKKYYFVQLSTGKSQWETPTEAAPTGPTPQATPQGVDHPYGAPSGQPEGEVIENQDGTRSFRYADGRIEPMGQDGERGLGQFAMNQLLGGGKKQNQSGGLGQLGGLASQFLGGGSSHNNQGHSSSGGGGASASGIVGALAGQFLGGGKKQDNQPQNYTGQQNQQHSQGGGLMGSLGGMFGGHSGANQGSNFGYSNSNQQGGYSGSAPPSSYQPSGTAHTQYHPPSQQPYANQSQGNPPIYGAHGPSYGQSPSHQQAPYGTPSNQQQLYGQPPSTQQQPYGQPPHQQSYGQPPSQQQQPPYGGIQHQPSYGGGHPPPQSQQYPPPPNSQPGQYAEMSGGLYGNNGAPHIPSGSRPQNQYNNQGYSAPGGYPGAGSESQQGRW